jgi:hypothetical protein
MLELTPTVGSENLKLAFFDVKGTELAEHMSGQTIETPRKMGGFCEGVGWMEVWRDRGWGWRMDEAGCGAGVLSGRIEEKSAELRI